MLGKVVIIGSTQYLDKIQKHAKKLRQQGYDVLIPAFDDHLELDDLGICEYNRDLIEKADRVDVIWDQRSSGTLFDFAMAFALHKKVEIAYLEPKTFGGVMRKYAKQFRKRS